ncbi:hypothetical protein [Streptomyces sp. NPDC001833]|uniref:hypothetical protein n=1 Tax=Streptomyces sp. NPDC001833 TaxID=3154658 RepID=UPI00332B79E2
MDSGTVEELNPYRFFASAAVYVGRLVDPGQLRTVVTSAVTAAVTRGGPAVVALTRAVAVAHDANAAENPPALLGVGGST